MRCAERRPKRNAARKKNCAAKKGFRHSLLTNADRAKDVARQVAAARSASGICRVGIAHLAFRRWAIPTLRNALFDNFDRRWGFPKVPRSSRSGKNVSTGPERCPKM